MESQITQPLFVEPDEIETLLGQPNVIFVDLCKPEVFAQLHVPGAIHLEYGQLLGGVKPAVGLLPELDQLNQLTASLGINQHSHVIAYDDEGSGRAARLAWTLHVMGFNRIQVINGGIHSWANEGHPVNAEPTAVQTPETFVIDAIEGSALAVVDYVHDRLNDGDVQLFDSRTPEEYSGSKAFALRGGHIPGAINLNWLDTLDSDRNMRLKPADELESILDQRGFSRNKEVITYCQTHHRSSHSYLMLKHLGFTRVRGYAGAWSQWGNDPSLPVAVGSTPGGDG
ncbi:MAG: sulfurtransferase [marine bacterium B5-7]|nr:MAG: sulfurtransferase [marine bacterium B5-7]